MNPAQRAAVCGIFDSFARETRALGLSNQEVAEFMLDVSARWLAAHGVSAANVHLWIARSLSAPRVAPLTAAARAANDFGSRR